MKKKLLMLVSVVLILGLAAMGILAYLTDRDSAANVFTVGDVRIDLTEDFEQGATLIPGEKIEKEVAVKNTGKNDAWVWYTITYPKALDLTDSGQTIIWTGFTSENHDNSGYAGNNDGEDEWIIEYAGDPYLRYFEKDGIEMVEFTVLYQQPLKTGATTPGSLECVYFDKHIDIDPEGNLARVKDGQVEAIDWNINEDGNPVVYVSAYAIQKNQFATVQEAYAAYQTQWGDKGTEYAKAELPSWSNKADTSWYDSSKTEFVLKSDKDVAGLAELVNEGNSFAGKTIKLSSDVDLGGLEWVPIGQTGSSYGATGYFQGTFDGQGHTISNMTITKTNGGKDYAAGFFGFLDCGMSNTIKNVTFDNAKVTGHHWTGVAAGYLSGTLEGVKVINSTVICTHANDDACGDKAGAVVGYINGTQGKMVSCVAENCTVKAGRDAGQVVGAAKASQVVSCTAKNVSVSATGDCTGANINNAVIGRTL